MIVISVISIVVAVAVVSVVVVGSVMNSVKTVVNELLKPSQFWHITIGYLGEFAVGVTC